MLCCAVLCTAVVLRRWLQCCCRTGGGGCVEALACCSSVRTPQAAAGAAAPVNLVPTRLLPCRSDSQGQQSFYVGAGGSNSSVMTVKPTVWPGGLGGSQSGENKRAVPTVCCCSLGSRQVLVRTLQLVPPLPFREKCPNTCSLLAGPLFRLWNYNWLPQVIA